MSTPRRRKTLQPFYLYRREDVSGVSGTGIVAVGVILPSGQAVMEWCSRWPTVTIFQTIDQVERIHGHGGRTSIGWGLPPKIVEAGPRQKITAWWNRYTARLRWIHLERAAIELLKIPSAAQADAVASNDPKQPSKSSQQVGQPPHTVAREKSRRHHHSHRT